MNNLNQQRLWSFIGIFLISLVVSLPFYSADALAVSLKITKNSGEKNIEGFLDAKGDTWSVEALISGTDNATSVDPKNVKININDNEREFGSCSDDALGKICKYTSPLSEGVQEVQYKFQVYYSYLNQYGINATAADEDVIKSDGSAPKVTNAVASQDQEGKVHLNFEITDKFEGKPFVGIKSIDIINADSGTILQKIDNLPQGTESFNYINDGNTGGIITASFSGEGFTRIKVSAEDWLGHKTLNPAMASFASDFIAPIIIKESLNFTQLGKFKGPIDIDTNLLLDVRETALDAIIASAEGTSLDKSEAECTEDSNPDNVGLWHCEWSKVQIKGDAPNPLSLNLVAKDEYGNIAQETLTKTFVEDDSPPEAVFGTSRVYESKYYITDFNKAGKVPQRIYLKVKEQGAGMDENGIRADLKAVDGDIFDVPDNCTLAAETFDCYWEVSPKFDSSGVAHIGLSKFMDKVGNIGKSAGADLVVDISPPTIKKLEFYGISESGEHDYFQSNDQIEIKAQINEGAGVRILVNLNGLVMDAATNYPENEYTLGLGDGWVALDTENGCQRSTKGEEGNKTVWKCTVGTDAIKSGPEHNVPLQIMITDTAGNNVEEWPEAKNVVLASGKGKYKFELLGKSDEASPDYWQVAKGYPRYKMLDFVDLDTTKFAYTRMPAEVKFSSPNAQALVLSTELIPDSCKAEGVAPQISRALAYGGNYPKGEPSPGLTLVLEFAPFDGRTLFSTSSHPTFESAEAAYTCKVKIYSQVGKNALSAGETQEVKVKVKFAFSILGAVDENLAHLINDVKGEDFMKFANALHYIDIALKWIKYILEAVMLIVSIVEIYDLVSVLLGETALMVQKTPAKPWAAFLEGQCGFMEGTVKTQVMQYLKWVQIPLQILSCNPDPSGWGSLTWYGRYQKSVLEIYNEATGRTLLGLPAGSLYDNIYLSIMGLCVPGVVYNMNKLREIYCRKIVCYGTEVPSGLATIDSCNDLYDLMKCEYWSGPAMEFIPFLGALSQIGKTIKNMFTSPVGLINLGEIATCSALCFTQDEGKILLQSCNWIRSFTKLLDLVESVVVMVKQPPTVTGSPYCDMADDISVSKLTGGKNYGAELPAETAAPPERASASNPYGYTEAPATTPASTAPNPAATT